MLKSVPCEPYLVGRVVYEAPTKFHKKFIKPSFLSHGPLSFPTIPPLLSLSPQNPLDHVGAIIRP